MLAMTTRYVILLHEGYGGDHLDLMVQQGSMLVTWQIDQPTPQGPFPAVMQARRIQDHRLEYLDYQGPVSGGRGVVRRVDEGQCDVRQVQDDFWQVEFGGKLLSGAWSLRRQEDGRTWVLAPS
jgi:predicted esterase